MRAGYENLPAIIIPAYNESSVISSLLTLLNKGVVSQDFMVVVACNGCFDNTADLVRSDFPGVVCLDLEKASKINAINEAEKLGLGFPRLYVDADVKISTDSVLKLIKESASYSTPVICAPRGKINIDSSDPFVKAFYSAWIKTPFYLEQGFGSGVYVLNRPAREQFLSFPEVIADDGYVREIIEPDQMVICESAYSIVEAPRKYNDLLNIKTRSKLGNMQLAQMGLKRQKIIKSKRFLQKPSLWHIVMYVITNAFAGFFAKKNMSRISGYSWQRDDSSRKKEDGDIVL